MFPYGTVMYIEGYGYGRVEDTGSGLKGEHVEIFFRSHGAATEWGRQRLRARVWFPPGRQPRQPGGSAFYSQPSADAPLEVVFDVAHVGDEIGPFNQAGMRPPAGDHQLHARRL